MRYHFTPLSMAIIKISTYNNYYLAIIQTITAIIQAFLRCLFAVQSKISKCNTYTFVLLSKGHFGIQRSFVIPYEFQDYLFQFCEKYHGYFDWYCIKYVDCFGQDGHFNKWQPTPVLLPGKSHEQRSVVGYSPWSHKESDTTEQLHFQPKSTRISFHFFMSSSVSFINVLQFSDYRTFIY